MTQGATSEQNEPSGDSAAGLHELADLLALHDFDDGDDEPIELVRRYLRTLADGGWLVASWPRRWGGRDADVASARRIKSLLREYSAPDLYPFFVGLNMVGPTLLTYGDDAQRDRWLPAIARGDELWCQMFSEPGAGSDLANVAMRAVRVDDGWLLQGQKVWTSRGAYASWGLCLARTDPEVPKHDGLTMFAVPMSAPGVTVRPLVQMNGDDHFSEVFVDDVALPEENRIGEVGQGWPIALAVLAFERSSIGGAKRGSRTASTGPKDAAPGWLRAMSDAGLLGDPVARDEAVAAYVEAEVTSLSATRTAARARTAGKTGVDGSAQKVRLSDSRKRRAYLMLQLMGADGMLDGQRVHHDVLTAPSHSLRGGTDEIQRNIVSERALGLPPEPRVDRGVPWSISRRGVS